MQFLVSIIFTFCVGLLFAQPGFFKEYSSTGSDFGQGIIQLEDSSYVITGASSSFPGGQTQAFLLKVDSLGTYQWSKPYGGTESDWSKRVFLVDGVGYNMAGYTSSFGVQGYDIYVFGTDLNGDLLYEKTYGGEGWERTADAAQTNDNGLMIVGETNSNPTANKDLFILRTDVIGDTIWTMTIGDGGDDYGTAITPVSDTTFMIASASYVEDSLKFKTVFHLVQDNGDVLWIDTLDYIGETIINDLIYYNDTLQVVGQQRLDDQDDWDLYAHTHDLINDIVFGVENLHQSGNASAKGLLKRSSYPPRMMVWGSDSDASFEFGEDLIVHRENSDLSYAGWADSYVAREGQDELGEIINTNDGGAIMVGFVSHRDGEYNEHVFLYKFSPNSNGVWVDETGVVNQLVGIKDLSNDFTDFTLYPNPTEGMLFISSTKVIDQINVFSTDGKLMVSQSGVSESIDLSMLSPGVYLIEVQSEKSNGVKRIVIN